MDTEASAALLTILGFHADGFHGICAFVFPRMKQVIQAGKNSFAMLQIHFTSLFSLIQIHAKGDMSHFCFLCRSKSHEMDVGRADEFRHGLCIFGLLAPCVSIVVSET